MEVITFFLPTTQAADRTRSHPPPNQASPRSPLRPLAAQLNRPAAAEEVLSDRLKENQIDKAAAERTLEPTAKEAYEKASQKLRRKILHGVITRDTEGR